MIFFLFIILIFITVFTYLYYGKDLLSPSIWLLFGYLASVSLAITQFSTWGDLSLEVVFVILLGILSFIFGGVFATHLKTSYSNKPYVTTEFAFGRGSLFLCLVFLLFVAYIDFRYITSVAYSYGFSGGTNLMTYARNSLADGETMPYSVYIPIVISQMLTYMIAHDFISGLVNKKDGKQYRLLKISCILVFTVITILSSGRTMLMYFLLFILIDAGVLLKVKSGWSVQNNGKIIKYGVIVFVLILVAFTLIDKFLRSSMYGTQWSVWWQITRYTSSSLYALDHFIHNPTKASETGYETLYNLYSVLNRLGFHFEIGHNYLEGTTFANVSTNVYTALRRYIHDFGYIGMVAIQFLSGWAYHSIYKQIKYERASMFMFIIYGTFIYAPVFNCIEERLMVNVLSLRSVMMLFFTYILMRVFARNKQKVGNI